MALEARSRPLYSPAPVLPPNFADRLLQLELEIESNCCLPLVNELMELYQQAIEYYEHEGDARYVDLQTRMHKTLLRSDVLLVLKSSNHSSGEKPRPLVASADKMPEIPASLGSVQQTQELIRKKKEDQSRALRPQATEMQRSLERVSEPIQVARSLSKMFETQENSSKTTAKQVQNDMVRQDEALKNRLSQRISSRKSSRISTPSLEQRFSNVDMEAVARKLGAIPTESPPPPRKYSSSAQLSPREGSTAGSSEAGEGRMQNFDDLEKKLEEVMERSYAEKHEKLAEIQKKYEAEIEEMQKEGPVTGLLLQVLEQTKVAMEQEMAAAAQAIDQKRRTAVQQVRLLYLSRAATAE